MTWLAIGAPGVSASCVVRSPAPVAVATDRLPGPSTLGAVVHICRLDVAGASPESNRLSMGINGHTDITATTGASAATGGAVNDDGQHTLRLRDPGELLEAVPYLIGFHPRDSLVVVGLEGRQVAVTLRLDIGDGNLRPAAANIVEVLRRAEVDAVIVV